MTTGHERYWNGVDRAPVGVALQVLVTSASDDTYLLPYPCRLTAAGWVNAISGTPLLVRPTRWRLHVETLPSKRAWARRSPPGSRISEPSRDQSRSAPAPPRALMEKSRTPRPQTE
jgi:hypothetical protein